MSKSPGFAESPAAPPAAAPSTPAAASLSAHASLGADGRLLIPAALRDAAGIKRGDRLFLRVEGEQIVVESFRATIKRLQDLLAPLKQPGVSIVDELIADRRAESRRESEE